jgi:SAM-dependent methyltransferase
MHDVSAETLCASVHKPFPRKRRRGTARLAGRTDSAYNAQYDRPAVLAALGHVTGRRVLDAACGPALHLRELLERGAEVTAFDASPVMVSLARQHTAGQVRIDRAALGEPRPGLIQGRELNSVRSKNVLIV